MPPAGGIGGGAMGRHDPAAGCAVVAVASAAVRRPVPADPAAGPAGHPPGGSSSQRKPEKTSTHRADIQGLRAVAVILVVLFHAKLWARGGFVGVDVFFVISGFVITAMIVRTLENEGRVS